MPLFDANKISIFSCRVLVRSVTTSELSDGKALAGAATIASDDKNGKADSDQTLSLKPFRGLFACLFPSEIGDSVRIS